MQSGIPFMMTVFLLFLACTGAPAPSEPPASQPPAVAQPHAPPKPETAPPPPAPTPVEQFAEDCSAEILVENDWVGGLGHACENTPFDQMCVSDFSGCYGSWERCVGECVQPCMSCDDACEPACEACKAECAEGNEACETRCGEERLSCANGCIKLQEGCYNTCDRASRACEKTFDEERAKLCPRCAELDTCQQRKMYGKDDADCIKEFDDHDKACFEWCFSM